MRCYNFDRLESKSYWSSKIQSLNKAFKAGRKPNKIWKKGNDKSPKRKISHRNIWRRKSEGESKKDDLAHENKEINNK
jgi:hypothetical protein